MRTWPAKGLPLSLQDRDLGATPEHNKVLCFLFCTVYFIEPLYGLVLPCFAGNTTWNRGNAALGEER